MRNSKRFTLWDFRILLLNLSMSWIALNAAILWPGSSWATGKDQCTIQVLHLLSNPSDTTRLRLLELMGTINDAVRGQRGVSIRTEASVRAERLLEYVSEHQPSLIHFSGHGTEAGELLLDDEDGHARPLSPQTLGDIMQSAQTHAPPRGDHRVLFLEACYSDVCTHFVLPHVSCVIAVVGTLRDSYASVYSGAFYSRLARGSNLQAAHEAGIIAIQAQGHRVEPENLPRLQCREGVQANTVFLRPSRRRSR